MSNGKKYLFASMLLLLFLAQSLYALLNNNLVIDEPAYIAVGYYFVKHLDTRMVILHPPLTFLLTGLPLLFTKVNLPYSYQNCIDFGYYQCSEDMIFKSGNDVEKITIYARLPFLILSVILGILLFLFAEEIYGIKPAFFALALYSFSPTILSYNTLVFTDFLIAFFVFTTIYLLWKLLIKGYTKARLALAGVSFGFAMASKFTAIFLIPIMLILFLASAYRKNKNKKKLLKRYFLHFMIIMAIGFFVLYSTYFFSFGSIAESVPDRYVNAMHSAIDKNFAKGSTFNHLANFFINDVKIPMPQYPAGFAGQYRVESSKVKLGYINGQLYNGGKWYYFFEVLLIKNPLPLIIFFVVTLFFYFKSKKKDFSDLFILLPILFFAGIFIITNFNLGLRHILPIMPFVFLFSSRIMNLRFKENNTIFRWIIFILLAWYIIGTIFIMPHYIAYFNEIIGHANGHKYLLSSNLDFGQDLNGMKSYIEINGIKKIWLSYHGAFDPSYYNISYEPLPMEDYIPWAPNFGLDEYKEDCSKKYGIIAISASNLHGYNLLNESCFEWLSKYKPIKSIGYTIFVYDIKK